MFVRKNISLVGILTFSGGHMVWLLAWASSVAFLYQYFDWKWIGIPWLPLSVVGTAVAFYIGFKNNHSYDRLWEARKIWGAIVNSSRSWGSTVRSFVTPQFAEKEYANDELYEIRKRLIYRHIAWLYTLRNQLLVPTSWEHVSQSFFVARLNQRRRKRLGIEAFGEAETKACLRSVLPDGEYDELKSCKNMATQIIDKQSQDLQTLRTESLIDDFRHMELQKILNDFYVHQGKCERIKKFPFPRQYGGMSLIFVGIFIFLLPFGMVSEFAKFGEWGVWMSIPFTALLGWIYLIMELVGDYSENPFEGLGNDIPMLSLCRTIEIDLREMLGESNIPAPIKENKGVLM